MLQMIPTASTSPPRITTGIQISFHQWLMMFDLFKSTLKQNNYYHMS